MIFSLQLAFHQGVMAVKGMFCMLDASILLFAGITFQTHKQQWQWAGSVRLWKSASNDCDSGRKVVRNYERKWNKNDYKTS